MILKKAHTHFVGLKCVCLRVKRNYESQLGARLFLLSVAYDERLLTGLDT